MDNQQTGLAVILSSAQLTDPRVRACIERPLDLSNIYESDFSPEEHQVIAKIAAAKPPAYPGADPVAIGRLLSRMAHMPMKDSGDIGAALMLDTYKRVLAKWPEPALQHAVLKWLETQRWFPGINEIVALAARWRSPEQIAIDRARAIRRCMKPNRPTGPPPDDAERSAFNAQMRRIGSAMRIFPGEAEPRNIEPGEPEPPADPIVDE